MPLGIYAFSQLKHPFLYKYNRFEYKIKSLLNKVKNIFALSNNAIYMSCM